MTPIDSLSQPETPPKSRFDRNTLLIIAVLSIATLLTALVAFLRPPVIATEQIAYLSPSTGIQNIWLANPAYPDDTHNQLTFTEGGIYDYDISDDGMFIAYAEQHPDGNTADLVLLNLLTRAALPLTRCAEENAVCTTPAWRPDGNVIAYQRRDLNDPLGHVARIWLLDMTTTPYNTFPLFSEAEVLGNDPQWSGDGSRLAFYDAATDAVLIYNFAATNEQQRLQALPAGNSVAGVLSNNGQLIVYPELLISSPTRAVMRLANLETNALRDLTDDDGLFQDRFAAWHPDNRQVTLTRQYLDDRFTRGDQVFTVDLDTHTLQPLIYDPVYQHSTPIWNHDGTQLVLHRFRVDTPVQETLPEIWLYRTEDQSLVQIAEDGFMPRWMRR